MEQDKKVRLHACQIHARQGIAGDTLIAGMLTEWLTREGLTRWPFEKVLWHTWRQSVNTDLGAGARNVGGWAERGVVILKKCHHLVLKNRLQRSS